MNLNLSGWDWLNAALGVLFLYRGIRDLYNGTGTGWSTEDEKKHFRKFYGIALHDRGRYTQAPEPTEEYIKLTRLEGIGLSLLCAVLLVVLLFAPK